MSTAPLLPVEGLRVAYPKRDGGLQEVVRGVSFTLGRERLGIVGESGSGKSQTGRAIMGLTAPGAVVSAKTLRFDGESGLGIDLLTCPPQQRRALRGGRMAMVMQDPKFPLSPVMRIGAQIEETLRAHPPVSSSVRRARMLQALADVGIDDPARVARLYPDEEADASSDPPNPPSQTAQAAPPDSIDSVPDAPAVPARPAAPERRGSRMALFAAGGIGMVVLGSVGTWAWRSRLAPVALGAVITLAVLPFKPIAATPRDQLLEVGMAESLVARLSNLPGAAVRSEGSVRRYAGTDQDPISAARELSANGVRRRRRARGVAAGSGALQRARDASSATSCAASRLKPPACTPRA